MIDEEKAALIDAVAQNAAFDGWTVKTLRMALSALGRNPEEAALAFPGGRAEMIAAYFTLGDERMIAARRGQMADAGLTARVRAAVAERLELMNGEKEAVRRAMAWLVLPSQAPRLARIIACMADAVWFAAGDKSADMSWYSKRAILGAVLSATLLYWLSDNSLDSEKTLAFLDRRLAGVGRFNKLKAKLPRFPFPRAA
ncbi:MAG: COQ9 family protein [Proteobacteria bacterium]|nr:COQ9 family protein [Pseudomonadota bacterium]MBU6425714.1 COQ9 family protein [Rhodospirillales bacterium]